MLRLGLVLVLALLGVAAGQLSDSDRDGFPDVAELVSAAERRNFLEWFAAIAEAQYTLPAEDWTARDCSGLLRYAFVEALKPKDAAWFAKFAYLPAIQVAPSGRYPLPSISRSVFRNAPGPFRTDDVAEGRLVGLANAEHLMRYSSTFIGRSEGVAARGDLLFFAHPLAEGSGFHSMVYLGEGRVVYHTGLRPEAGGEVRLLSLATLRRHPDPSWRPNPENLHFLGFFRWNIAI